MPVHAKSERQCRCTVGAAEAVDRLVDEQAFLAAIDRFDGSVPEAAMAVVDRIAAAVGGNQKRFVPRAVEQRRHRVRFMVVTEMQYRARPEAAVAAESCEVEQVVIILGAIATHFVRHVLEDLAAAAPEGSLLQPAQTAHPPEIFRIEQRPRHGDHIDIGARGAGDFKHFVDAEIRVLTAGALDPGQPLKLDGRFQIIVIEQRCDGIVRTGMKRENKLRHASPSWPRSGAPR